MISTAILMMRDNYSSFTFSLILIYEPVQTSSNPPCHTNHNKRTIPHPCYPQTDVLPMLPFL